MCVDGASGLVGLPTGTRADRDHACESMVQFSEHAVAYESTVQVEEQTMACTPLPPTSRWCNSASMPWLTSRRCKLKSRPWPRPGESPDVQPLSSWTSRRRQANRDRLVGLQLHFGYVAWRQVGYPAIRVSLLTARHPSLSNIEICANLRIVSSIVLNTGVRTWHHTVYLLMSLSHPHSPLLRKGLQSRDNQW